MSNMRKMPSSRSHLPRTSGAVDGRTPTPLYYLADGFHGVKAGTMLRLSGQGNSLNVFILTSMDCFGSVWVAVESAPSSPNGDQ